MKRLFLLLICFLTISSVSIGQKCATFLQVNAAKSGCRIGDLDLVGNTLTIEASFNRTTAYDTTFSGGDLVSKHQDPTNVNYLLRPNSASITTTKGFFSIKANCNVELNKTYHVAMVYDGKFLKLYRNGFLMGQVAASGNLINNDYITTIGATADLSTIYPSDFIGYVNEVRIWTVPRTQSQIQQYLNSQLPTPDAQIGLQAYYQFNSLLNKQGNSAWDAALLGNASLNKTNASCAEYFADSCNTCLDKSSVKKVFITSPNNPLTKAYFMENVSMGSDASQIELLATSWTSGGYYNGRSLIVYDVSQIPQNAVVNSAKLYLYAKKNALNGIKGQPTYGTDNAGLLQKVISYWNSSNVNMNNLPLVSNTSVVLPKSTNSAQDYIVDVANYVQDWVANPASNYGMMLRMQKENNPYNSLIFESGAATDSTKRPRLEICYTVPNILPATLVSFDVQYQVGQFADIQFATANELNLATIQVEKSVGGSAFTTLTTLNAKGGTSQQYNVQDATPTANTYYRLKLVNTDGSFVYSSVAKLAISAQEKLVRLQPNPLVGAQPLVVTITNSKEEVAAYRLYNFAGKRIAEKTIYLQKGVNTIKIAEIANLVPGSYHLQVVSANQTINKKVVKMD